MLSKNNDISFVVITMKKNFIVQVSLSTLIKQKQKVLEYFWILNSIPRTSSPKISSFITFLLYSI